MEKKGRTYIEIKEKENYKKKRVCVPHRVHTVEKEL
jgi:cytosine/adenosine deaminase-related metal-dependent hydrolase